jgi:Glycosyl hydrolase family 26
MNSGRAGRSVATALAVVVLLGMLALAASASAKAPKRGLYWGAWIGSQLTGTQPPWDMAAVSSFESTMSKGLSTIQFGVPFADCSVSPCSFYDFPSQEMEAIRRYGALPFLSWSSQATPWVMGEPEPDFQLSDVISGTYDSYIRGFAEAARAWGHPYFMRFNWEPNGDWFPWGEAANGNQPGEYVTAWRHVHDIFAAVGATNTTWVWCPYIDSHKFAPLASFYPGDEYVDWTCLDGYNWAKARVNPAPWKSFDQIFAGSYHQVVTRIAPTKPMVLGEIASSGGGGAKAEWIRNMFRSLRTKFRRVRGLIWFDQVQQGVSWPLENSPIVTRAFAAGLSQHPFRANKFGALSTTPIPPPR